jgi:hypothetical protein
MDHRHHRRLAATLATLLAVAAFVAGCGALPDASRPLPTEARDLLGLMESRMLEAGSVRYTGTGGVTGSGEVRFADGGASHTTIHSDGTNLEIIMLDGQNYVRNLDRPGEKWQRTDTGVGETPPLGPQSAITALRGGATALRDEGKQQMDGTTVTRYVLSVDLKQAAEAQQRTLAPNAPSTVDYTLWVGQDGLLRRVQFTLNGTEQTVDYTDWGAEVKVEAPPKDQVAQT